jgi:hypothetical protein
VIFFASDSFFFWSFFCPVFPPCETVECFSVSWQIFIALFSLSMQFRSFKRLHYPICIRHFRLFIHTNSKTQKILGIFIPSSPVHHHIALAQDMNHRLTLFFQICSNHPFLPP